MDCFSLLFVLTLAEFFVDRHGGWLQLDSEARRPVKLGERLVDVFAGQKVVLKTEEGTLM